MERAEGREVHRLAINKDTVVAEESFLRSYSDQRRSRRNPGLLPPSTASPVSKTYVTRAKENVLATRFVNLSKLCVKTLVRG